MEMRRSSSVIYKMAARKRFRRIGPRYFRALKYRFVRVHHGARRVATEGSSMAIHRIVTTTLGLLEEDTPSSSRPTAAPLYIATNAVTAPLVRELPRTESEPLGSFSWRIGTNRLLLNKERTTPFSEFCS